jgi:hypothetical protein
MYDAADDAAIVRPLDTPLGSGASPWFGVIVRGAVQLAL